MKSLQILCAPLGTVAVLCGQTILQVSCAVLVDSWCGHDRKKKRVEEKLRWKCNTDREREVGKNGERGGEKGIYRTVLATQPLVVFSCFKLLSCPKDPANDLLMPE